MNKLTALLLALLFTISSCESDFFDEPDPCLQEEVDNFKQSDFCDDSKVEAYFFDSETVYVFSMGSCIADGGAFVKDHKCESIGFLGGIAGNTEIDGKDFYDHAEFIRVVWEK